jgi:ribosomal protein L40E
VRNLAATACVARNPVQTAECRVNADRCLDA